MERQPVTLQDIYGTTNTLEELLAYGDTEDNYQKALVHNQVLMIQLMDKLANEDQGVDPLKRYQAGWALEDISNNNSGKVMFDIDGNKFIRNVKAGNDIDAEEVVYINDAQDMTVVPAPEADMDALFGISGSGIPMESDAFEIDETDGEIQLDTGEKGKTIEVTTDDVGYWWQTGTYDQDYTNYEYKVDGESVFSNPLPAPIGLYNNMYEFPQPIRFRDKFEIEIQRDEDAPGQQNFASKVVYFDLGSV